MTSALNAAIARRPSAVVALVFVALAPLARVARAQGPGPARPPSAPAQPSTLEGTWQGTLRVTLPLRLNVQRGASGWTATLDSPDQKAYGIPAASVTSDDDRLKVALPSVGAIYEGRLKEGRLAGSFTQHGYSRPLDLQRTAGSGPSFEGTWAGVLDVKPTNLLVKIERRATGWAASVNGIPMDSVSVQGNELALASKAFGASCEARLEGDRLRGIFRQHGQALTLDLERTVDAAAARSRPQDPKRPFPYEERSVLVENQAGGVTLACTLTEPRGPGPFGAVVLATGSGPQDRDEALLGHRPFLVLADALTRKGVAVLRCDDRGVGKSTGTYEGSTTFDFAEDTLAELAALRLRPEIARRHVGVLGHSEGALVAAIAAAQSRDVAFISLLAGPALPGDQTFDLQRAWLQRAGGMSEQAIAANRSQWDRAYAVLKTEKDEAVARRKLRALYDRLPAADRAELERSGGFDPVANQLLTPWVRAFLALDPRKYLTRVTVPVLDVNGERDSQVLPRENLAAMRKALRRDRDVTIRELPGLNHLLQSAKSGAFGEYEEIEETIAPAALTLVTEWIAAHAR